MLAGKISRNAFDIRLLKAERNLDNIIELSDDFAYWDGQELANAVALATNTALALGRELFIKDFTSPAWASDAASIDDLDSFTTIGIGGMRPTAANRISAGKTYTMRIKGTTTAVQILIRNGGDSITYKTISGPGAFDETFNIDAIGMNLYIKNNNAGTTDIDWPNTTIKQTDIAASSDFPGANVIVNPSFATDTDWTKGDAAITIAGGKATWSGAQAGNADLTQTVAPLANGIRYKQFIVLSGVSAGTITPIFGTQAGTALNANGTYPLAEEIANGTAFLLRGDSSFVGSCELVKIQPANPINGDYTGVTLGQPGNRQVRVMVEYGGAADYADVDSAEFNSILDPTEFALSIIVQKDTWDAAERYFFSHTVDANNWIRCGGTSTIGQLLWEVRAGGTTEQILLASGSPTDIFHMGIQVKSGVMSAIYRGEIIATEAVAETFVGNFDTMIIGAKNDTPNNVHLGKLAYHVHSTDKTAGQWLREAKAAGAI